MAMKVSKLGLRPDEEEEPLEEENPDENEEVDDSKIVSKA